MNRIDRALPQDGALERRTQAPPPLAHIAEARPLSVRASTPIALTTPPVEAVVLNRMAFGPRPGEVARVRQIGVAAYIEEQLNPASIDDSACNTRIAAAGFAYLDSDLPTLWHREGDYWEAYDEVVQATWLRAVYSKRQLQEVLVDHWHNHFNVYGPLARETTKLWPDYHRRIRRNLFGNFRQFLEDIAKSPSMLYYLDNYNSTDSGPNENYARELFELHTLGSDAYTPGVGVPVVGPTERYRDGDVYEAARALTGWTISNNSNNSAIGNTGEFAYYNEWHDRFQKFVLGDWITSDQPPMKDGLDVLDRLATNPATARNVAKRLARRLVADEPSASLVQAGTDAFLTNKDRPDQLRHVYRALLTHPDFTADWGLKIKRPFEAIAGAMRATNADLGWSDPFYWYTDPLGQPLFEWSPPDGFSEKRRIWVSSLRLARRWSFFNSLCLDDIGNSEGRIVVDVAGQTPANLLTARQIVDFWIDRTLGFRPSDEELGPIYDFMSRGRNLDIALPEDEREPERLSSLVGIILAMPSAQVR